MTTMLPDFPYSVSSEPDENWTVEDILNWCLLQSHRRTDEKLAEMVAMLRKEFQERSAAAIRLQREAQKESSASSTVVVEVVRGPHQGTTHRLQPKPAACMVGRSAGKKFRERGVSLPKDTEVSTTHGRFEIINGKAYFTDLGSTNGTFHKNTLLEPNSPFPLADNMELVLGSTIFRIKLELRIDSCM